MPLCTALLPINSPGLIVDLLELDGADGADFWVVATELAVIVEDWVDVKTIFFRATCKLA